MRLGVGTEVGFLEFPYPNPKVILFIRDCLKALKAVQAFDHSPRTTPCRKLWSGGIDGDPRECRVNTEGCHVNTWVNTCI